MRSPKANMECLKASGNLTSSNRSSFRIRIPRPLPNEEVATIRNRTASDVVGFTAGSVSTEVDSFRKLHKFSDVHISIANSRQKIFDLLVNKEAQASWCLPERQSDHFGFDQFLLDQMSHGASIRAEEMSSTPKYEGLRPRQI